MQDFGGPPHGGELVSKLCIVLAGASQQSVRGMTADTSSFFLSEKRAIYSSCSDGGSSVAAVDGCWELHVAAWVQWVPVLVCACLCLLEV